MLVYTCLYELVLFFTRDGALGAEVAEVGE